MRKEVFEIQGGYELNGKAVVRSAKNAVLPMLAGAMLTQEQVTIENCPYISDVENMFKIRDCLCLSTNWSGRNIVASGCVKNNHIPEGLAGVMRSSVFMLGPLLVETGRVKLHMPGGCKIGARPIDIHLSGLEKMGAKIDVSENAVYCEADRLIGADIVLRYPSVGATENLISAAVKAKGKTILIGAAREPEVVSFCEMLISMGAKISGVGTPVIKIEGVDSLHGARVKPTTDRIASGTIILATALIGGRVFVDGCNIHEIGALATRLVSKKCEIVESLDGVLIESDGDINPFNVSSGPYPKFPTDLQPIAVSVLCQVKGQSIVEENVFENRFTYVDELVKMGANISVCGDRAIINGNTLFGADVVAKDLRGGAGLVVAGLNAKGTTTVAGAEYIDRGYEMIENIFSSLGAKIERKVL